MEHLQKTSNAERKVFRFRFSPLILVVLALVLVLCAACVAITTWQVIEFLNGDDISSVYSWITYLLMYFVGIFLAVLVTAMLIKSQYIVTDKEFILQFGIIKSKYELKKIYSVRIFRKSNKLTVYFDDFKTKYMVVVVKEEWYDDFIRALTEYNEKIEVDCISPEEENEWKNNKK